MHSTPNSTSEGTLFTTLSNEASKFVKQKLPRNMDSPSTQHSPVVHISSGSNSMMSSMNNTSSISIGNYCSTNLTTSNPCSSILTPTCENDSSSVNGGNVTHRVLNGGEVVVSKMSIIIINISCTSSKLMMYK